MNNLHQNNSKHTIKHVFTAFSQQKSGTNIQNFIFWWIYREIRKWKPKTTHLRIQRVRIFKILKLRNAFSMPIICVHDCTFSYFGTFWNHFNNAKRSRKINRLNCWRESLRSWMTILKENQLILKLFPNWKANLSHWKVKLGSSRSFNEMADDSLTF